MVLILTNTGREQTVQCALREQSFAVSLPPDSITTLVW
jgi:glucosylceramidase